MVNRKSHRGQSVVEMALVLPLFLFCAIAAIQLACYCHDLIEMQRMAMVAAYHVSNNNLVNRRLHYWFTSLQGTFVPAVDSYQATSLPTWRPAKGLSTVTDRGRLVQVKVTSQLFPGAGFSRVLGMAPMDAKAEILLEPPAPKDN